MVKVILRVFIRCTLQITFQTEIFCKDLFVSSVCATGRLLYLMNIALCFSHSRRAKCFRFSSTYNYSHTPFAPVVKIVKQFLKAIKPKTKTALGRIESVKGLANASLEGVVVRFGQKKTVYLHNMDVVSGPLSLEKTMQLKVSDFCREFQMSSTVKYFSISLSVFFGVRFFQAFMFLNFNLIAYVVVTIIYLRSIQTFYVPRLQYGFVTNLNKHTHLQRSEDSFKEILEPVFKNLDYVAHLASHLSINITVKGPFMLV